MCDSERGCRWENWVRGGARASPMNNGSGCFHPWRCGKGELNCWLWMGDATLRDVGCTLGALRGFYGSGAGGIGGLWMGEAECLPVCHVGVGRGCWRGVLVSQSAAV